MPSYCIAFWLVSDPNTLNELPPMLPLADCVPGAIGTTSKNWLRLVGMFASVS